MHYLNSQPIRGGITANIADSFGPFLALDESTFVFDVRAREVPIWLGYNASPLFGLLQFAETWTGEWSPLVSTIEHAYVGLRKRLHDELTRQVSMIPVTRLAPKNQERDVLPAELIYHYLSLSILDQYSDQHQTIVDEIQLGLSQLMDQFADTICNPYVDGPNFTFGFEFVKSSDLETFGKRIVQAGILWQPFPLDSKQARFHLNLSYRPALMKLFWQQLNALLANLNRGEFQFPQVEVNSIRSQRSFFQFHRRLLRSKTGQSKSLHETEPQNAQAFLQQAIDHRPESLSVQILTAENYLEFREQILAMQKAVYEPARQSPPEEFDMLFNSARPLGIAVTDPCHQIVAMTFAGQLGLFTEERGVTSDPYADDPDVFYSMDLTIMPEYRGGLGSLLKQAMILLAKQMGVKAIHGRNRDRAARGMWAINLALGGFELQHLPDDYPDQSAFRDCFYYRCPLEWNFEAHANLPTRDAIELHLAAMTNGLLLKHSFN